MCFNPLFIGAGFLTSEETILREESVGFQSPIHRGWVFNAERSKKRGVSNEFQSPIHRGWVFNTGSRSD